MPDSSCSHCGQAVAQRQLRSCGGCLAISYCGEGQKVFMCHPKNAEPLGLPSDSSRLLIPPANSNTQIRSRALSKAEYTLREPPARLFFIACHEQLWRSPVLLSRDCTLGSVVLPSATASWSCTSPCSLPRSSAPWVSRRTIQGEETVSPDPLWLGLDLFPPGSTCQTSHWKAGHSKECKRLAAKSWEAMKSALDEDGQSRDQIPLLEKAITLTWTLRDECT
jgi:hypothetical protein